MADYDYSNHYNSISIDSKHDKLYEYLTKSVFRLNNKFVFILLTHLAIAKNLDVINTHPNTRGKSQLRSFTDTKLNYYLYALIIKLAKRNGDNLEEVFGNADKFKYYIDLLAKYAFEGAEYLLNNELASYKQSVPEKLKPHFILNLFEVLDDLSKDTPF